MTTSPQAVIKVSHMSNKNLQDSTTAAAALELSHFKCTQRGWYIIFLVHYLLSHMCHVHDMLCLHSTGQNYFYVKSMLNFSLPHVMNRKVKNGNGLLRNILATLCVIVKPAMKRKCQAGEFTSMRFYILLSINALQKLCLYNLTLEVYCQVHSNLLYMYTVINI